MAKKKQRAARRVDEPPRAGPNSERKAFPVVGIGASAGGLKAAEELFDAMPTSSGMAFVLVQHLDPVHESSLAELLQKHTEMPVTQVSGETEVLPDHVYVIPPNRSLIIRGGVLGLADLNQPRGRPAVIDQFFRSLAEDRTDKAIGIVLSGSGTEGARGLEAIKERGGITLAQDDTEAEYSSMPRNAVASGCVDLVLPVAEMPGRLLEVKGRAADFQAVDDGGRLEEEEVGTLEGIYALVRSRTGHDFNPYKRSTMLRRIGRRMRLRGSGTLADYQSYLRENPHELDSLFREFLISVTEFFRDPEALAVLGEKVIPELLEEHGSDETVRIWVPGCATGEEAYSLAILFAEASDGQARPPSVQIFATDIDESAIAAARRGLYPASIREDVSPARIERFFVKEESGYRVRKGVRETVLFTRHNLLDDPPFSKLDLVSCRNLLIYLTDEIQAKAFGIFQFALRPGGYLFLGNSESLGRSAAKFSEVNRKAKLFRRRDGAARAAASSFPTSVPVPGRPGVRVGAPGRAGARGNGERTQRFLLERLAPPCVIVDDNWSVTYVSGRVGRFLEHTSGKPTQDILELARDGLALDLRLALSHAVRSGTPTVRSARVADDGGWQEVRLVVEQVPDSDGSLLVIFDEPSQEGSGVADAGVQLQRPSGADSEPSTLVAELEAELKSSKAALQETIEDLETANEELRAGNEELQSMNEELQSTGEELQTSQEELQSTNEELVTVNQELRSNVEELSEANSVLDNLAASTDIATVFLDGELHVRRYTPRANELFHLIQADVGRPFEHVAHRFERRHLLSDAEHVNTHETPVEREVRAEDGAWFLVRTLPYHTVDKVVDGVVITLVDISARKLIEEALHEKDARLRFTLDATGVGEWDLDPTTHAINRSFKHDQIFGYDTLLPEWSLERLLEHVHPDDRENVEQSFARSIEGGEPLAVECRIIREDGSQRWIHMRGHRYGDSAGRRERLLGIVEDVTERIEAERVVREFSQDLERRVLERTAELEAANDELETFTYSVSHDLRAPLRGIDGFSQVLLEEHGSLLGDSGMTYLQRIRAAAQRMGHLIDDLLALSRLSHGKLSSETVDLSGIVEHILQQLTERMPERRVNFVVEKGISVTGDAGLLEIALQNLIANAWKFTAMEESACIEFGQADVSDGERVFCVRDNGVGFDTRHSGRLFTPFQRLHSQEQFEGMGVGLATVQRVVRRHKGKIWAEAEVGKGATFFFTLPRSPLSPDPPDGERGKSSDAGGDGRPKAGVGSKGSSQT